MRLLKTQLRLFGLVGSLLLLAACASPTPALGTQAVTVAPAQPPVNTQAGAPTPTAAGPAPGYPEATLAANLPRPTNTPQSYPATRDPYEAGTATNPSAPVFITYRDFEIEPAQTTIKVGTEVTFLIRSDGGNFHQPYAGAAAPFIFEAPPEMGNGVSFPITFSEARTLTILCGYHGNMHATVIVQP